MNHSLDKVGTPCPVCKRTICLFEFSGTHSYTYCSEFCDIASEAQVKEFQNASPGELCLYPCCHCGAALEDDWSPTSCCSSCDNDARAKNAMDLLKQAKDLLEKSPLRIKDDGSERLVSESEAKELVKKIELALEKGLYERF